MLHLPSYSPRGILSLQGLCKVWIIQQILTHVIKWFRKEVLTTAKYKSRQKKDKAEQYKNGVNV